MTRSPILPEKLGGISILETLFGTARPEDRGSAPGAEFGTAVSAAAIGAPAAQVSGAAPAAPAAPSLPPVFGGADILPLLSGEDGPPADPAPLLDLLGSPDAAPGLPSQADLFDFAFAVDGVPSTAAAPAIPMSNVGPGGVPGSGGGGGGGGRGGGKGGNDTSGPPPVLAATYRSGEADYQDADGVWHDFFNIDIEFYGAWSADLMDAFGAAADFLSSVITQGLRDDPESWRSFEDPATDGYFTVDDLLIEAYLPEIDGAGGADGNVLGRAGAYSLREGGTVDQYTTVVGVMEFDSYDAAGLLSAGNWDATILHEMLHILGLNSTIWSVFGVTGSVVLDNNGTPRPTDDVTARIYIGESGLAAYEAEKAAGDPDYLVIEQDGGSGTANSHWDEDAYDTELMTGWLDDGAWLADWSIAALADVGYTVVDYSDPSFDNALSTGIDLETAVLAGDYTVVDGTLIA